MENTELRHEWKFEINAADRLILRQRLRAVLEPDPHAVNGRYLIRSLYFETPTDRALREKLDGVSRREKFRLRFYNGDTSLIHLEKKSKLAGLGNKQMAELTCAETERLLGGDTLWMREDGRELVRELCVKMTTEGLRPKTVVDYTREPYIYGPGGVRVTLDYGIRTGLSATDFLDPGLVTVPVPGDPALLEVKWDSFLPQIVRDILELPGRRAGAFSKYAQSRIYG